VSIRELVKEHTPKVKVRQAGRPSNKYRLVLKN
jgi:hypothetical protein